MRPGQYEQSDRALRQSAGTLPEELEAERRLLIAQGLLYRKRYDQAIAELSNWQGPRYWLLYGQFNLGVALVRAGQAGARARAARRRRQLETKWPELMALRDKANLAIGYARCRRASPRRRAPPSNACGSPARSPARHCSAPAGPTRRRSSTRPRSLPWQELQGRNLLDAAVQESFLAVPYAYAELGAMAQAVEYYERAIAAYDAERVRIGESIDAIRSGDLLAAAMKSPGDGREGWFAQLATLPDSPESRYLYHLLAGHEFQEGLKNYRALDAMGQNLSAWAHSLGAFADMVATRRLAFEQKLPAADARLATVDVSTINGRRDALQGEFEAAVGARDVTALATDAEREQLDLLDAVDAELAQHAGDASYDEAREKARLSRGVLMWKLDAAWKVRCWQANRALRDLNATVYDARTRETASGRAREGAPERNAALGARVETLSSRASMRSRVRVENAKAAQARRLADIAVRELEDQRKRLDEYSIQARYALATIYDRAAAGSRAGEAAGGAAMSRALVAAIALALAPLRRPGRQGATAAADAQGPEARRRPEVRTGETVAPDPDRAKELYRDFLELEGGDPALRTEAMRRLGDLQIEVGRQSRAARRRGWARPRRARRSRSTRACSSSSRTTRAPTSCSTSSRAAGNRSARRTRRSATSTRLVATYPSSPRIDEAQFRRGEILFSAKRYAEAQKAYEAASAFGAKSEFYEQSLYKLGWSLFKQSENEASFDPFVRVLDLKLVDPAQAGRGRGPGRRSRAPTASWCRTRSACCRSGSPTWRARRRSTDFVARTRRDPVRLHALFGARRPLRRQAALHGRRRQPTARSSIATRTTSARRSCRCRRSRPTRRAASRSSCWTARRNSSSVTGSAARSGRPHARAVPAGRAAS